MAMEPRLTTPAPSSRNRFLDVVRTVALVRILVWHTYGYAWLSYLIASMPAMFFVAGSLMAHSLGRNSALDVLYRRFRRLLIPFWAFGAVALAVMSLHAGELVPHGRSLLWWALPAWDPTGSEWGLTLTAPLWYLRCLTWLIVLSPLLVWLWRRIGPALLLVPLAAVTLEAAGSAGVPWQFKDLSLFGFFWLAGFAYNDGLFTKVPPRAKAAGAALCAVAAAAWLLTQEVPDSIVNLSYPLHFFVGAAWLLAGLALEQPIARFVARPRLSNAIAWINDRALSIYLWQAAGLMTMYQLLWTSDHAGWLRIVLALPIVLSVTFLAVTLFSWVEAAAGRRGGITLPSLPSLPLTRGRAVTAAVSVAGVAAIALAMIGVVRDPGTLVQATAHTVPPSGAGLHYRAQKAEIVGAPPVARETSGRTDPVTSEELQAALEAWIGDWNLKGATVSLRRENGDTWTGAAGVDDEDQAFYSDEPYWIASVTKTFTAALILRLSDEGYLNLDDTASRFLPDFPDSDRFTIRQLLQHTSGLTSESEEPDRALAEAAAAGLQFEPGTAYLYSRAGYYLLGLIVEQALGTSFTDALQQQILGPLQLTNTVMDEQINWTAYSTHPYHDLLGHSWTDIDPEQLTQSDIYTEQSEGNWEYHGVLWSAGGLWSTTDDLTRWALALYDSGQVVSPPSLKEMTTFLGPQFDYTGLGTYPFCTCWWNNGVLQSERWGFAGTTGILEYDIEDRIAIAVHMNGTLFDDNVIDALEDFSSRIRTLVRGRPVVVDPPPPAPSIQVYMVEDGDTLYEIAGRLGIPEVDQERWVNDVRALNQLDEAQSIVVGAQLILP